MPQRASSGPELQTSEMGALQILSGGAGDHAGAALDGSGAVSCSMVSLRGRLPAPERESSQI